MKKFVLILLAIWLVLTISTPGFAQLKRDGSKPNISGILTTAPSQYLLGLFDPTRMHMRHSFSMSYSALGGSGLMLGSYMNTIDFLISENLTLRADLGILTSPYNTFGENFYLNKPKFFGGAELNYRMGENTSLMLRFDTSPYLYHQPGIGQFGY
jgi:hypothetical protein